MKKSRHMLVTAPIELPQVPNFVRLTNGSTLPIHQLDDAQLRALGEAWTDALIQHATDKRKDANHAE